MNDFNTLLLQLIGSRQLTRKKIADVCRCSLSHVDQVFRAESDWSTCNDNGVNEWQAIVRMGFDLEIPEIVTLFVGEGKTVTDWTHMEFVLDGSIDDEQCELMELLVKVRNKGGLDSETNTFLDRCHHMIEQIRKEIK